MNLSYWEIKNWFSNIDYTVVGSGIVGLHCALRLRERYPDAKIIIIEKGLLPEGASTKNAGFACFGSISEIIDDLKNHSEQEVIDLVAKRKKGLQLLRNRVGDHNLDYQSHGGYELFLEKDSDFYDQCLKKIPFINDVLTPVFGSNVFIKKANRFSFAGIHDNLVYNPFEAQIDTGKMMQHLLKAASASNILILNNQDLTAFNDNIDNVDVALNDFNFKTKKLLFATNGFASQLTQNAVQPARAQVLITKPIDNLRIKGTFHLDNGYYYFRNIDYRILIGGGRNLDFVTENTTAFGLTNIVQNRLEELLKTVILPETDFEIEHRWSGIMGMGNSKKPIIEQLSDNVYCGVRLGGMGVAIGSLVGTELANLI